MLDVIVVVGIIGILVSILVPMVLSARERAGRTKCADNLREIGVALRHYALAHQGRLPTTRPTHGPVVLPDVSNHGFQTPEPGPNNVPSVLFQLIRGQNLPAARLVCPSTSASPDLFEGVSPLERSNFTDLQKNLSYAVQNPYADDSALASGFEWTNRLPADFPLVADRGPGGPEVLALSPNSPLDRLQRANSENHSQYGQNVLYADGRVEFREVPFCGLAGDNIYATRDRKVLASPNDWSDSILLPTSERPVEE